jgi:predicted secreted protein with PEFG-CTERM motif
MQHRLLAYALILTLLGSLYSIALPAIPVHASHENITVNIVDDVSEIKDPGDSITIEGTIDDVQEGEDVTVRILDPNGGEEEEGDVTPDEDDGYFDFPFEIPNDADGGIWTVEVTYDGDEAFSYFMVEYDEDEIDVITVVLDEEEGIYQANDEVSIEGQVAEPDDEEEFVRIIVLDPTNGELLDDDEVELDDDEFTFEFELDDAHGRYAVLVTYNGPGDQQGAAVLEIEDEDEGNEEEEGPTEEDAITEDSDGDLSAEIDEGVYEQGGTVLITGTIEDYDPDDNEELGISILDPEETEIEADDDVFVDEDGSDGVFEFEYDIDDDADEGLYTIVITYDNDEVELKFVVEEGSGSDDGGGSVTSGITSGDLTAKLNRASYLAGESITVSGEVDELKEDDDDNPERVFVLLYRPNGIVILQASENVEPSSDGSFSVKVVLDTDYDLEEDDDYWVTAAYVDDEVKLLFDITGVSSSPSSEITVETDEDEYEIGQTVEISGEVPDTLIEEDQRLLIRVNTPDGNPCRIDPIDVPSSGSFTYELVLGGVCGVAGEYEVEVTYGDEEASTSFELIGSSASTFNLRVEDRTYPIEYELSGGAINSIFPRPSENKLVISLDAEEDGQLTVVLPREVIDAIEDGEDIDFIVMVEDDSGNVDIADFEESENSDDERTLVIDYEAGTGRIEIAGTQVVPEFGAIAAIILAIATTGIIMTTARYGNKFSLFRQ